MQVQALMAFFNNVAPYAYQESYDNSRLLCGHPSWEIRGVLTTLDCLEATVEEAVELGCNVIVAHHPIIFSGLKSITGSTYVERTIIKAIKHDIAIISWHTNLDNVPNGVNKSICDKLGLENTSILQPKWGLMRKLVTFVPQAAAETVRQAICSAGGGKIGNYDHCTFNVDGTGTFKANEHAKPFVGEANTLHHESEVRIETVFDSARESAIVAALLASHPYEEPAYDILSLQNSAPHIGSGMIGYLPQPLPVKEFLHLIKKQFKVACIKHTELCHETVLKIAVCGGAGGSLLANAIAQKADVFITSDYKYHEFFDANNRIIIADIGHYESEQFTINLIYNLLNDNFSTFALHFTRINTNPVNYFI